MKARHITKRNSNEIVYFHNAGGHIVESHLGEKFSRVGIVTNKNDVFEKVSWFVGKETENFYLITKEKAITLAPHLFK